MLDITQEQSIGNDEVLLLTNVGDCLIKTEDFDKFNEDLNISFGEEGQEFIIEGAIFNDGRRIFGETKIYQYLSKEV